MIIQLKRIRIRETCAEQCRSATCDGQLWIDGRKVCNTTENPDHRPLPGTYDIQLLYHTAWGRKMPTLIPHHDGPLPSRVVKPASDYPVLGIGNGTHNIRDGRILVGQYCVPGVVIRSREAFMPLYDRINNSLRRGNQVQLIISDTL